MSSSSLFIYIYIYIYTYVFIYIHILTGIYPQYIFFYEVTTFKKVEDLIIEGLLKLLAKKTNKTNSYSLLFVS